MSDFSLSPQPTSNLRAPPSPLSEILSFREEIDEEDEQEEDIASITTDTVKKQQRKRWKKPADHPKRPLSAYNLFFQWGRERLLAGESLIPLQQADIDRIDVDTRRHAKRRHRREHGVIGFTELAKMLGTKWKELDPDSKEMFQRRADVEKIRYEKAVSLYKAEKGELLKDSTLKETEAARPFPKAKKLAQQRKKLKGVQTSQGIITTSNQKFTLREDVEISQPQTYDTSSALYRQALGGSGPLSHGINSGFHRGDNEPYFFDQQRLYASRNQVSGMPPGMSLSAPSTFLPPAVSQASYIQSNSAAGAGTSLRDYVDSMGPPPLQHMQSVWGPGTVTNMPSQAYHSLTGQAYHNANYMDAGRFPGTEISNHSYYSMPLYGQLPSDQTVMGLQPQSTSYAQYPNFSRYPSAIDPLRSRQTATNLVPSQMNPGMKDEVDGLSSTSQLNYFE
ncbi:hypothetical protein FisN_2Lh245 [Fistulifera solaris]|uniref:HMG box domain-containing protein n=1 Tax=Fistulifera solaris TaxID=1519565 RepID=A0A1Z5KFE0_FISSO|nr:hypothetical protein FisN_2Lh245 [Fistulifera solaris]|eukprot:GAX24969.1 hypothetical protein FisN_2Lh245 [Fistulifera solaris]